MRQDAQTHVDMAMLKSFLFHWRAAKTMAQNTDSRFGLTAARLSIPEDIIFETVHEAAWDYAGTPR